MRKGIFVITAALLVVMLVYGCTENLSSMLPFGDKNDVDVGPVNEVSKLFFTATLLQTEVFPSSSTTLTFRTENKWENSLKNVEIRLEGFSFEKGTAPLETQVVLNEREQEVLEIRPGAVNQQQFRITMPSRLTTMINIRPVACFDYEQMYRKDLVLIPEFSTVTGTEVKPDGPLNINIPRNVILASADMFFPSEEYIDYSVNRRNVDSIIYIDDLTVEVQTDDVLLGINTMSFVDSYSDAGITCEADGSECKLDERYTVRHEGPLQGLVTLDINKSVSVNQYKAITMTVDGRYCVDLPTLTLSVRKV